MWEDTHCCVTHVWAGTPHPQTQPRGLRIPRTDHTSCPSGTKALCSSHYIYILFWWWWNHDINLFMSTPSFVYGCLWPHLSVLDAPLHAYSVLFFCFCFCSKQWWLRIPRILKFNVTMEVVKTLKIIRHGRKRWENTRYVLFAGSCLIISEPVFWLLSKMKNQQLYQHTTLANIIYLYQLLHATLGKHNLSVPSLFLMHNFCLPNLCCFLCRFRSL